MLVAYPMLRMVVPPVEWMHHVDRLVELALLWGVIRWVVGLFKWMLYVAFFFVVGILAFGSITGRGYRFQNVVDGYKSLVYNINEAGDDSRLVVTIPHRVPYEKELRAAANYHNDTVRDFALQQLVRPPFKECSDEQYTSEMRTIVQAFAVFKTINSRQNYVSDTRDSEIFTKASKSIQMYRATGYFQGDCDDHTILMCACIESIGGRMRMVLIDGHIYPELYIGTKGNLEMVNYLIHKRLFPTESRGKEINYHVDEHGDYWLNMDYTAKYPGGKFMKGRTVGIIDLER